MAKFFKDYNKINLEILESTIENLSDDQSEVLKIGPKYLGMSHMKMCDFCPNVNQEDTLADEIVFLFGYQICDNCYKKDISKTFIKKWFINNNSLPIKFFFDNLEDSNEFKNQEDFRVQRTDLRIEDNWKIDSMELIKYKIRDDDTEDIEIPMYRSSDSKRHIQKNVFLTELCRFNNNLSETKIINEFKRILKKLK